MTATVETPAVDTSLAQALADARALLNLIEATGVPLRGIRIQYSTLAASDQVNRETVNDIADALGIVPDFTIGGHYEARVTIGTATYYAVAIPSETMRRLRRVDELGEAALAAEENGAAQ